MITSDKEKFKYWDKKAVVSTYGIDLSHWNGPTLNWSKLVAFKFVFIKASQGSTFQDPQFKGYWAAAKRLGILKGAYHFWEPLEPVQAQCDNFSATLAGDTGDLPLTLDLEKWSPAAQKSPAAADVEATNILLFLQAMKTYSGKQPIIYTNPETIKWVHNTCFSKYPLWLAAQTSEVIKPWSKVTFWQNGFKIPDGGPGISMDAFFGDITALKALCGR